MSKWEEIHMKLLKECTSTQEMIKDEHVTDIIVDDSNKDKVISSAQRLLLTIGEESNNLTQEIKKETEKEKDLEKEINELEKLVNDREKNLKDFAQLEKRYEESKEELNQVKLLETTLTSLTGINFFPMDKNICGYISSSEKELLKPFTFRKTKKKEHIKENLYKMLKEIHIDK